jgi:hypothetical protein
MSNQHPEQDWRSHVFERQDAASTLWRGYGQFFLPPDSATSTNETNLAQLSISSSLPRKGKNSWRPVRGLIIISPLRCEVILDATPNCSLPAHVDHKLKPDGDISIERYLGQVAAMPPPTPSLIVVLAQAGLSMSDLKLNIGPRTHVCRANSSYVVDQTIVDRLRPLLVGLPPAIAMRIRDLGNQILTTQIGRNFDRLCINEGCTVDTAFEAFSKKHPQLSREVFEILLSQLPDCDLSSIRAAFTT